MKVNNRKVLRQHFNYPGILFSESLAKEIKEIPEIKDIKFPKGSYSCFFTETIEQTVDGVLLKSAEKTISPEYFHPSSLKLSYKEVEKENKTDKNLDILLSNMRNNDWQFVIKTVVGIYRPFVQDKTVILC